MSNQATSPVSGAPVLSDQAVAPFEAALAAIPDAGQQGYERILQAIADAKSVEDLDAPWRTEGMTRWLGQPLTIRGISKMPSSYEGGIPWFLVVDAVQDETGEPAVFTTGAISVVAQLVQAFSLGAFPLRVIPTQADRPSSSGTFPQHLVIRR